MLTIFPGQKTSRHYFMVQVFVPENWDIQIQHATSPIMSIASWSADDGTPEQTWVRDLRLNSVQGDIQLCKFMVPIYRGWAQLSENASQVFHFFDHDLPARVDFFPEVTDLGMVQ
jgi:hypothetical protein